MNAIHIYVLYDVLCGCILMIMMSYTCLYLYIHAYHMLYLVICIYAYTHVYVLLMDVGEYVCFMNMKCVISYVNRINSN